MTFLRAISFKGVWRFFSRSRLPIGSLGIALFGALFFASSAYSATASWSLTPSNYDFGSVPPASEPSAPAVFTLTNTGEVDLPPPHVELDYEMPEGIEPRLFDIDPTESDCEDLVSLPVTDSCRVDLVFRPLKPGPRSGGITFTDPSGQVPPATASFEGVGAGPIASFSPTLISLGSYLLGIGQAPPKVVSLSNTGNEDLRIIAISLKDLGTNPNQVVIVGGTCRAGGAVVPNGSCTIQIAFTPTQGVEFTGHLRVEDNALQGFQEIPLEGIGALSSPEPPDQRFVRIIRRPPPTMTHRVARFRFAVNGGGVPFVCRLDFASYRPCRSPTTYRHLTLGVHVFHVKPRFRASGLWGGAAAARFRILPKNPKNRRMPKAEKALAAAN